MTDAAKRSRVRLFVGAILAAYAVQLAYVMKADEPYPALMMPRFGWAGPPQTDGLDVTEAEIEFEYAGGVTRHLTLSELMESAPEGHRFTIVDNLLSPLPPVDPERRAPWNKIEPPHRLFPGYNLAHVTRHDPEHRRLLARWLSRRARLANPQGEPRFCRVTWYQAKYRTNSNGDPERSSRSASGRFEIAL